MKISLHIGTVGCPPPEQSAAPPSTGATRVFSEKSAESKAFIKAFYDGASALQQWVTSLGDMDSLTVIAPKLTQVLWPQEHIARNMSFLRSIADAVELHMTLDTPQAMAARLYAQQIRQGRTSDLRVDFSTSAPASRLEGLPKSMALGEYLEPWCRAHQVVFSLYDDSQTAPLPSDETLERHRQINLIMAHLRAAQHDYAAMPLHLIHELAQIDGAPLDPFTLGPIAKRFADHFKALEPYVPREMFDRLFAPCDPTPWQPPALTHGFRASQYIVAAATQHRRIQQTRQHKRLTHIGGAVLQDIRKTQRAAIEAQFTGSLPAWAKPKLTELLELGKFAFDRPIDRPSSDFPVMSKPYKGSLIITCMKNEGPYLLDWLAFHRSIGFEHFIIYANDCTDGTDEMLKRLDALGYIAYRPNSEFGPEGPQIHALRAVLDEPLYQSATLTCHIDADEFINIQCGDGTLDALRAANSDATHVALSWRMFGHDGQLSIPERPIFEVNQKAAPTVCPFPHYIHGIKTLSFAPHLYQSLGAHRPKGLDQINRRHVKWINGSGQDMTARYRDTHWRSNLKSVGYELVQLNHYALRSLDGYFVKRARGRALHVDDHIDAYYWMRMDWNDVYEPSILRHRARFSRFRAQLMADARLEELHKMAIMWHSELAHKLKQDPALSQMAQDLTSQRLSATERMAYCLAYDTEKGRSETG